MLTRDTQTGIFTKRRQREREICTVRGFRSRQRERERERGASVLFDNPFNCTIIQRQ